MSLAGLFGLNSGTIKNLFVQGDVTNTLDGGTGGIAGSSLGKIEQCVFTGNVGSARHVGGIAGVNGGEIIDCYNTSNVKASEQCGGGIAGTNDGGTIARCHNVGRVLIGEGIADEFFGSITGNGSAENVTDCYYLEGTYTRGVYTGTEDDPAVSLTKDQLKDQTGFTSWNFDDVWIMDSYEEMPVLRERAVPDTIEEIYTEQDLKKFRDSVNGGNTYKGKTVKLMNDIELNINEVWMPIGGVYYWKIQKNGSGLISSRRFSGVFDGQNHTVSGLNISECLGTSSIGMGKEYQGFFGYVSEGDIKNFTVEGLIRDGVYLSRDTFSRQTFIGGAAAFMYTSDISNVRSYMDTALTEIAAEDGVIGGVVGELDWYSYADGCTNYGNTVVLGNTLKSRIGYIGGVIGDISYSDVCNCVNYGGVTVRGSTVAGGVNGEINRYSSMSDCANHGKIIATADGSGYIGGITGRVHGFGSVDVINCLNTGKMICASACVGGGIVGSLSDDDVANIKNNYYLDTSIDADAEFDDQGDSTAKTAEQLALGEAAYLLGDKWGQEIGADIYPVLGGEKVYRVGDENNYKYTNTPNQTELTKEPVPTLSIDYINEKLTGYDGDFGDYIIIPDYDVIPEAPVTPINDNWSISDVAFGATLTIVKRGNGTTTANSDAQTLYIPERPAAPEVTAVPESALGQGDGKITGVSAAMEYKPEFGDAWIDCGGSEVTGLTADVYLVRKKAADSSFAGECERVTVSAPVGNLCVKITATYNENGALLNVTAENVYMVDIPETDNGGLQKVFYWESLESMKPIVRTNTD